MSSTIENKLNRAIIANAVTLGTDYAALQLYSTQAKPIRLYGINWGVRSTTPADYALIAFNDLRIIRGLQINISLTVAQILALNFEEIYHSSLQGANQTRAYENFGDRQGFELEPGWNYVILNGDASTTAGTAGTVSLFLTVRGALFESNVLTDKRIDRESSPAPDPANGGNGNEQKC